MAPDSASHDPSRPQLVTDPPRGPIRVVLEPPRASVIGTIVNALKWAVILLVVVPLMLLIAAALIGVSAPPESSIEERWHSLSKTAADKVAIISLSGTIIGDEGYVKAQLDRVKNDDRVKAVVLRVDSPGGTVTGSDYIYHHLKLLVSEKQIPLVVSMGSIAASGGYYVAMAAGDRPDSIFAEPTTWTGSIGVVIPHYDLSGLLERFNVADDSVASNPLKLMGSPTRKFSEPIRAQEQEILQGLVDASFQDFKEIVLASRPALRENKAMQDEVFTGRIFTAKQAQENHLIDKIGFIEDAIDQAIKKAGLSKSQVQVVKYKQPFGLFEQIFLGAQGRAPRNELAALLDLATPRAYYLCTWAPGLSLGAR